MSSLPSDPAAALVRVAEELTSLRGSIDALAQRLGQLTAENSTLRAQLDHSETARADLVAQVEHLVELLGDSRRELRGLWQKGKDATK